MTVRFAQQRTLEHKPAATSGSVMAIADAPKLPIDITEAF